MAGAGCAGLGGTAVVPDEWLDAIEEASRMDVRETGRLMASAAQDILRADRERATARLRALAELGNAPVDGAALPARAGEPA